MAKSKRKVQQVETQSAPSSAASTAAASTVPSSASALRGQAGYNVNRIEAQGSAGSPSSMT